VQGQAGREPTCTSPQEDEGACPAYERGQQSAAAGLAFERARDLGRGTGD